MIAAVVAAALPWRVAFAIGVLPVLLVVFVVAYVPESPRWLADQGRLREARRVVAWLTERPEDELALEAPAPPAAGTTYSDLWRYRSSVTVTVLAWLGASIAVSGLVLWGPTFLERILDITADEAAVLFLLVALGSFAGRLFFSFVPQRLGRRTCGLLMGVGAVPPLVLAAFSGDTEIAGVPLFLLALIPAAFFVDGGFANLAPAGGRDRRPGRARGDPGRVTGLVPLPGRVRPTGRAGLLPHPPGTARTRPGNAGGGASRRSGPPDRRRRSSGADVGNSPAGGGS
jgi:putative MFS transporter